MKKSWFLRLQNVLPLKKVICSTGLALAMLMANSPAALASESSSDEAPETEMRSPQDTKTVTGTVVDQNNEPIPGVSVVIDGTNKGTITEADGNFSLSGVLSNDVLVFSFVGMTTQEIPVEDQSSFNITMKEKTTGLDEVVVVGFGSQKKANLTGSVSTVDSESLESRPVKSVDEALQGVIPGLNMSTAGLGGELNQSMNINIRGTGTIGSGSSGSPLVLIDGVEGDLSSINPQDIKEVTVLKDAAASSIYGSRAAFGVVMITTKEGTAGESKVTYNNNFRWTSPLNLPSMMDSHTFAQYYNEAAANAGQGPKFSQEVLDRIVQYQNGEIDYGTVPTNAGDRWQFYTGSNANTDWFEEQYKDAAFAQDHNISASGGSENTRYYTSAGYLDQNGLGRHTNDDLQRYTLTAKINSTLSDYVKFNASTKFSRTDYQEATHMTGLFYHNIARRWPTVPVKDPNGFYTDPSEINQLREGGTNSEQDDWLYLQGQLIITPAENWNIHAEGNYKIQNFHNHQDVLPAYAHDVAGDPYPVSVGWNSPGHTYVYEYNRKSNFFTSNIYSDYEFDINQLHNFKVMAGFNSELQKYRTVAASRTNLITPNLPTINTATDDSKARDGQYQHWSTAGFFSRLNYNYKERYLLELNARYDGSSRFLGDKRWNLFPSFSAGWNIAKENFWGWENVMQMFKLRGSYGELGNQNTNNWYPFYASMPVSVNSGSWLVNGEQPTTANAPGIVSSQLTWERVSSWNLGADMAFLQNRLNVNFDYFERNTYDMVGPAPKLPNTLGTGVPRINNADMRSYGFELEALWKDKLGDFSYSVRAVLSDDQQEVTKYPNPTNDLGQWYEGQKMGEIWGYTTAGLAKSQQEMDAHLANVDQSTMGSNWQAGDIMYADTNGDGEINNGSYTTNDPGDLSVIGNSSPRYRYSLDLNGEYKGFDMRIFLQGVGKRDWMPNGPYFWGANGSMWQAAGFEEHMDFYRDENSVMVEAGVADVNKDAYFPRPYFGWGNKNGSTQTRWLQDASYLRLKNIQLGYTLPKTLTERVGISKARFFVSGENLLTFTDLFEAFDPETVGLSGWNDGKTYPLSKVISGGVNINF